MITKYNGWRDIKKPFSGLNAWLKAAVWKIRSWKFKILIKATDQIARTASSSYSILSTYIIKSNNPMKDQLSTSIYMVEVLPSGHIHSFLLLGKAFFFFSSFWMSPSQWMLEHLEKLICTVKALNEDW